MIVCIIEFTSLAVHAGPELWALAIVAVDDITTRASVSTGIAETLVYPYEKQMFITSK